MAKKDKDIPIRRTLRRLFPSSLIQQMARESGAVLRQRKVDIAALFWTVVLGFAVRKRRSLAALRRGYQKSTGQGIEESSFYDRFSKAFAQMLKKTMVHALDKGSHTGRKLTGVLDAFKDVVMADATVLKLHQMLASQFAGTRTNSAPAAAKVHVVMSVTGASRQAVRLTGERTQDGQVLRIGPWVKERLMLFDLGYFKYQLFARIQRNQGYFVSRLKSTANPLITKVNRTHRGNTIPLVGRKLKEVLPRLRRQQLDVMVEVRFQRRSYAGKKRWDTMTMRLVGARDRASNHMHLYLTNVPFEKLGASDIAAVYAARWQVELLFAQLKGSFHLDELPSTKPKVVEALVYASILTMIVSRRLLASMRRRLGLEGARVPEQRWAVLFASIAQDLLRLVTWPLRETWRLQRELSVMLLQEVVDPNKNRLGLLEAIGVGQHRYAMAEERC